MVVFCVSTVATAQPVVDPTRAEFNPSADHNTVLTGGSPAVTSYELGLYLTGASLPFQTNSLGKPNPDADGIIRVSLTSIFAGWPIPGTSYAADVAAVGPNGTSRSTQSNAFSFSTQCAAVVAPLAPTVAAAATTRPATVTATAGCAWTATSNVSWITVTSGATGTGAGTVNYSIAANTGISARIGTLTVAGQTVTVTQAAPCTFTASPLSPSFASAANTGSVTVTSTAGCGWTATSNAAWITITSGASGSGNGTVNYSITANTGTTARTGTMTVAGQTVTVTQNPPCTFSASPLSPSFASGATTGSVAVTAASGCSWTATSNAAWITITSGASGSGNGTVNYSITANTGTTARTGTMTVAGQTVTVTQNPPCTFSASPLSPSFASGATTGSVAVTAASGCSWTATSNAAWITITSGASGSGNGNVNYSITANTGTTARTGTMTVAGQTVTVTQNPPCTITVSPASANVAATGGTGNITVTAGTGCTWTATDNATWLTITAGASGTGNGTVTYSATANTGQTSRNATVTIGGQTVGITQAGAAPSAPSNVRIIGQH